MVRLLLYLVSNADFCPGSVKNSIIVLEWIIYNKSQKEQAHFFEKLLGNITTKSLLEIIGEFIKDADGEFIVQIVTSRKVIIFNNYIGSLPLYYTDDPNCIIISREIKTILEFAERIEPDRKRLTEYLMFEHALGIGTIFKNIYRIESASVLEVDLIHKNLHVYKSSDWNFVQEASPKDKKGLICELVVSLDNAVQNRVKVFECEGYKISADLSGGHDSRVILAL